MNQFNANSFLVAGIGSIVICRDPARIVKTYSLGSCLGVCLYDEFKRIGGMIHIALPRAAIDREKAELMPGYFADTGLPLLIGKMKEQGALRHNLTVKLAGGANVMSREFSFDIGKRNLLAVRKILWKHGLGPIAEDTGGNISRTVSLYIADGRVEISSGGRHWDI
ncbi:MAG TPA: chemotaxis protein CheD [Spirochaetota bacterium]|nr:chemotaxis protein CheD [Spirochaetota bacterium]